MISMQWFWGMSESLEDAHKVRREVFGEEQGVPECIDLDGTDGECIHLVLYDCDMPVATGRVRVSSKGFIISRVATLKSHRGRGFATGIMQALIGAIVQMGGDTQMLSAQVSACGFYERLGFIAFGDEYDEAGITHVKMKRVGGAFGCSAAQ